MHLNWYGTIATLITRTIKNYDKKSLFLKVFRITGFSGPFCGIPDTPFLPYLKEYLLYGFTSFTNWFLGKFGIGWIIFKHLYLF